MKLSNKTLAFATWGVSLFYLLQAICNSQFSMVNLITGLISVILQVILGFAIYRDRNDKFTFVVIIIFAATSLSIPVALIIALMLVRKYAKKNDWATKCWFVPATVSALFSLINFIRVASSFEYMIEWYGALYPIMTILGYLVNILNFLVLGYWLIKSLDIRTKAQINEGINNEKAVNKLAFYEDLRNRGVLSDSEFEAKKAEIEQAHTR